MEPTQSILLLHQHLKVNRQDAAGFYLLGTLHRQLGQWSQALCAYMEACRLDPAKSDYHLSLGVTLQSLQQPAQAIAAYAAAWKNQNNPAIRFNIAQALLLDGKYEEGWKEYEWRIQASEHAPIFQWCNPERHWKGQPFPGQTLVVYHEQGLGDDLQFCRYLPYVKALGGTVIFSTRSSLIPVLSTLDGVDQIVDHSEASLQSLRFHWAVPLMSLPLHCGTTLHNIPSQIPYLSVPPASRQKWQALFHPYQGKRKLRNIGFVYSCNPASSSGALRSCPLPLLSDLFSVPNTRWFSLQKGDAAVALQDQAVTCHDVIDLTGHIEDFGDTAALLEQLDLLISVDTSVPHLAGAIGKPVWMMLPYANEWRWLLRRSDSPWYPTFRLFRQPGPGQWAPMVARIRQALLAADEPFSNRNHIVPTRT